jgi:7-carboxy-7-deazaguanine synthase
MLRITEIFYSIQGEARYVGLPTVFVRLTGCPMRCSYCDSAYAFHGGEKHSLESIIKSIQEYDVKHITVTGGEPLAQPKCIELLKKLCDLGYTVSLETGNAIDISQVDQRVHVVLDIKTPDSNEEKNNRYSNLLHVSEKDQLKFVIASRNDYVWAKNFVAENALTEKCEVLFSPVTSQVNAKDLAEWILSDQLRVRFQIQLHKQLWGDIPGV